MRLCRSVVTTMLLSLAGCGNFDDSRPTQWKNVRIDGGGAESVRVEVRLGAGPVDIQPGGNALLEGDFGYKDVEPVVRYDKTGFRGRLLVEPGRSENSIAKGFGDWKMRLSNKIPLNLSLHMGAGEAKLDLTDMMLEGVEVHMGVGELDLNLRGTPAKSYDVSIRGGVGEARIDLPKDVGVIAEVRKGIGEITVDGMQKRDGNTWATEAYGKSKTTIRVDIAGGVGEIRLNAH